MKRNNISLRQVLNIFINELMCKNNELLLRDEQHKIVNHILDNSSLKLTADFVELTAQNWLGIDKLVRDKELRLPRFITFDFSRLDEDNLKRTWYLRSYKTFEELENSLYCCNGLDRLVMIDNEILNYNLSKNDFKDYVVWGQEVYKLSYIKDDLEREIFYTNKFDLEIHMCVATSNDYKDISVYNLVSKQCLDYSITETINSKRSKAKSCKVFWADNTQQWGTIDGFDDYYEDDYEPF